MDNSTLSERLLLRARAARESGDAFGEADLIAAAAAVILVIENAAPNREGSLPTAQNQPDITSRSNLAPKDAVEGCTCEHCMPQTPLNMRFIVCALCGNKRCPHATHHANACTKSNEPGQLGSSWENFKISR